MVVLEGLQPRLTPPGWPIIFDYALMLLLPIGAIIMSIGTSLPGWSAWRMYVPARPVRRRAARISSRNFNRSTIVRRELVCVHRRSLGAVSKHGDSVAVAACSMTQHCIGPDRRNRLVTRMLVSAGPASECLHVICPWLSASSSSQWPCYSSGANRVARATTKTHSSAYATVGERTKFLNQYVTFRRTYETFDFDIMY